MSEELTQQAQRWYLRLNDPVASVADRQAFNEWLAQSAAHERAYQSAVHLWGALELPARQLGASGWHRVSSRRTRLARPAFAAAASLLAIVIGVLWRDPGLSVRLLADYSTLRGEREELVLADGSHVLLDADSAIDVRFGGTTRGIVLLRGRAWFDVAHDSSHPFHVAAGAAGVRVLGTAFVVERRGAQTRVAVERGRVAVSAIDATSAGIELGRGDSVIVTGSGQLNRSSTTPESLLAWRRGLLVFDQASLQEVAEELSRSGNDRVVIASAALRKRELSGVFRSDDSAAVLAAIDSGMNVRVIRIPAVGVAILHEE